MTTKPTPTRKPTGRKAERPRTESDVHNPENVPSSTIPKGWRLLTTAEARDTVRRDLRVWEGSVTKWGDPISLAYKLRGYAFIVRSPVASKRTKAATRKRWRALKVGDVRPRGYQYKELDERSWLDGVPSKVGAKILAWDAMMFCYRASVTGKAKGRRK